MWRQQNFAQFCHQQGPQGAHLFDQTLCVSPVEEEQAHVPVLVVPLQCSNVLRIWLHSLCIKSCTNKEGLSRCQMQPTDPRSVFMLTASPAMSTNSSRLLMTAYTGTPDSRALMSSGLYATSNIGCGRWLPLPPRWPLPRGLPADMDSDCTRQQ